VPDEANGNLRLTVGFTEAGVDAVVWGTATTCQYLVDGRQVSIHGLSGTETGEVRLTFGNTVAFQQVAQTRMLLDLDIAAELDGMPFLADFDFRVDPTTETLEVRVAVGDGDIIVVASQTLLTGVRAQNGDFGCDESTGTCVAGDQTVTF
jgi:hypothetical protein